MKTVPRLLLVALAAAVLSGCATGPHYLPPDALQAPQPMPNSSGEYIAPFTSDGTVAAWVEKALSAELEAAVVGKATGQAAKAALEQVPLAGVLGDVAGSAVQRKLAVEASGGWEFIRGNSDLSFNDPGDLSIWLYAKHSANPRFQDALKATFLLYPDIAYFYDAYLTQASTTTREASWQAIQDDMNALAALQQTPGWQIMLDEVRHMMSDTIAEGVDPVTAAQMNEAKAAYQEATQAIQNPPAAKTEMETYALGRRLLELSKRQIQAAEAHRAARLQAMEPLEKASSAPEVSL